MKPDPRDASPDFRRLPERVPFEAMTTGHQVSDPPSPEFGRDPDHEWMLRFGVS